MDCKSLFPKAETRCLELSNHSSRHLVSAFGNRLLRERLGLSQAEFAAFTGIGEASLSRWERGLLIPSKAHNRYLRLIREHADNVRLLQAMSGITPPGAEDNRSRKSAARVS